MEITQTLWQRAQLFVMLLLHAKGMKLICWTSRQAARLTSAGGTTEGMSGRWGVDLP